MSGVDPGGPGRSATGRGERHRAVGGGAGRPVPGRNRALTPLAPPSLTAAFSLFVVFCGLLWL